jgi:hypothetical protein
MANNPHLAEVSKATQFTSENQPENSGRRKNYFDYLKDDNVLSQNDLDNIVNHISKLPLSEIDRLIDLIKNNRKNSEVQNMPLLYFKILEGMTKAKTTDILQFMRMSGKASEKHEVTGKDGQELIPRKLIYQSVRSNNTNS